MRATPNGNRTSRVTPVESEIGTHDEQDRVATYGRWAFTYTPNGELKTKVDTTNGATNTYTYDGIGALRKVQLPDGRMIGYAIDPHGRRVAKKVNGSVERRWVYGPDALHPVLELDGGGSVVTRFVGHEYMVREGATYRMIADELGSIRLVVDVNTGTIAQRIDYDEYGRVLSDTSPGFQPFGFAGGMYDPDTGLVRFGARDFDSVVGRWTTKDAIRFEGGDSNLYAYTLGDPINRRDPSGLIMDPPTADSELTLDLLSQLFNAAAIFERQFRKMQEARWIGGDKYFHCLANCEAARLGMSEEAEFFSDLREYYGQNKKPPDPPADCEADQEANRRGREEGRKGQNVNCRSACADFRPRGLPLIF